MKKGHLVYACAALALILVPAMAAAWHFDYEIYGNILNHPAYYGGGGLTSGGEGIIEFTIDDTGWPLDPNARWGYLWNTFFKDNYDTTTPGAYKWVGTFTGSFYLEATNAPVGFNGWCEGGIAPKITIWDANANGSLDSSEAFGENLFDARLSKLCTHASGGEMACMWGFGSMASNYFSFKLPAMGTDTLYNGSDLYLFTGCSSATTPSRWGSIKALYR
jgi:hypothetical protein